MAPSLRHLRVSVSGWSQVRILPLDHGLPHVSNNMVRDKSVVELRDEQSLVFAVELSTKFCEMFT